MQVSSTHIAHDAALVAETRVGGETPIIAAKALVTPSKSPLSLPNVHQVLLASLPPSLPPFPGGSVLCSVGCENGQVKVFPLSLTLSPSSEFSVTTMLATEFHPTNNPSGIPRSRE